MVFDFLRRHIISTYILVGIFLVGLSVFGFVSNSALARQSPYDVTTETATTTTTASETATETATTTTTSETATTTPTSAGELSCAVIDNNWKEYGQRILGANMKVSDVVLNACVALTGSTSGCQYRSGCRYRVDRRGRPINAEARSRKARGCTPNRGASRSQHLHDNAIDLRVPRGKEADFIALAVCGLRRVNNCRGGIGAYTSGSLHVDVRTGSNSIWSDNYKHTSVPNLSDRNVKNALYNFQSGKCTGGSIATNYDRHDEEEYGPPIRVDTPSADVDVSDYSYGGDGSSYTSGQWYGGSDSGEFENTTWYEFFSDDDNDTETNNDYSLSSYTSSNDSSSFTDSDYDTNSYATFSDSSSSSSTNNDNKSSLSKWLASWSGDDDDSAGVTRESRRSDATSVSCDGVMLFGMQLFNSCNSNNGGNGNETGGNATSGSGNYSTLDGANILENVIDTGEYMRSDDAHSLFVGGSSSFFSGVYIPSDAPHDEYNESLAPAEVFVVGEARSVSTDSSLGKMIVQDSASLAKQSIRYGGYFGILHGFTPVAFGSAPSAFVRLGSQAIRASVYNR